MGISFHPKELKTGTLLTILEQGGLSKDNI